MRVRKKTGWRALLLALAMALALGGCGAPQQPAVITVTPPAEDVRLATPLPASTMALPETQPFLSLDNYPRMDGSTANLPLMAAVMSAATGISLEEAQILTDCSTTPNAYFALADGAADILLVYEAAESTKELLAQRDIELELIPIGRDALVFLGNESNPVTDLTREQLRGVYAGEITNWSELGGRDQAIIPFQRAEASGSQALFSKLLMGATAPMQPPVELIPETMGQLIERVAEYNNDGAALGYSVYYYANYMYAQPGLRFFSVDGVAPSDATIASGEYPFLNEYYVAIRKSEPANTPARRLAEWIASDAGREVMRAAGYIPIGN